MLDLAYSRRTAATRYSLIEMSGADLPFLDRLFRHFDRADPYSLSAAYFGLTGRNGLWVYGDDQTAMMIARHPNLPKTLLFFPPIGPDGAAVLEAARRDPALPPGEVRLARIGPDDALLAAKLAARGFGLPEAEAVLDWGYPVHVLDVERITAPMGQDFKDFRKNVHRAERRGAWAEPIDIKAHEAILAQMIGCWANGHDHSTYAFHDLAAPILAALQLLDTSLPIKGLLIHEEAEPAGLILWEETDPARGIANSVANLSIGGKGLDEFAILKMCEHLKERGFREVCIGGSETAGLDAFKRKLNPIRSIELRTLAVPAFVGAIPSYAQDLGAALPLTA